MRIKESYCFYIVIIFVITMCLSSCDSTIQDQGTYPDVSHDPQPSDVKTDKPIISFEPMEIIDLICYSSTEIPGKAKNDFEDLVLDELQINLNLQNVSKKLGNDDLSSVEGVIICGINLSSELLEDKQNKVYPLNNFIEKNETLKNLPAGLIEYLRDENGDIWFLPTAHRFMNDYRIYNDEVMNSLSLKPPEDFSSLIDTLEKVQSEYSEDESFAVISITRRQCLNELMDILNHYGVELFPTGRWYKGVIGWNVLTNRYEDSTVDADINGLLDTLAYLRDSGIIEVLDTAGGVSSNLMKVYDGNLFSTVYKYEIPDGIYSSVDLTGNRNSTLGGLMTDYLFLPIGNEDPQKIFDVFIDRFYGSNRGNIIGIYGECGINVIYNDSYTEVEYLPLEKRSENQKGMQHYIINLVGKWLTNDYVAYPGDKSQEEKNKIISDQLNRRVELLDGLEKGIVSVNPPNRLLANRTTEWYKEEIYKATHLFEDMIFEYLLGNIKKEEFMLSYIKKMKSSGIAEMLQKENEKTPGAADFWYDD